MDDGKENKLSMYATLVPHFEDNNPICRHSVPAARSARSMG